MPRAAMRIRHTSGHSLRAVTQLARAGAALTARELAPALGCSEDLARKVLAPPRDAGLVVHEPGELYGLRRLPAGPAARRDHAAGGGRGGREAAACRGRGAFARGR